MLCGWVSVERRGKLYDDFKKYWAVLWREPPDEQARNSPINSIKLDFIWNELGLIRCICEQAPAVHEPEPEPEPGRILGGFSDLTASQASDFEEDDPRRLDPNFVNLPVHEGVTCDKCGMFPIRGTKF